MYARHTGVEGHAQIQNFTVRTPGALLTYRGRLPERVSNEKPKEILDRGGGVVGGGWITTGRRIASNPVYT